VLRGIAVLLGLAISDFLFFSHRFSLVCAMKALFDRFNRGLHKDSSLSRRDTDLYPPNPSYRLPQLPPLREWPPPVDRPQRPSSPSSTASFEPLSEAEILTLLRQPHRDGDTEDLDHITTSKTHPRVPLSGVTVTLGTGSQRVDEVSAERSSHKTGIGNLTTTNGSTGVLKNVASIRTAPTPASSFGIGRPSADDASATNKNTVERLPPMHPRNPHGLTSNAASAPRTDVGLSKNGIPTVKATTPRPVPPPYPTKPCYGNDASIHPSHHSSTPFSKLTGSVLSPASWSEAAEEDLVTNFGPRERTRQEVLWEIVASEER
jgi:hypothetical protein